jgi:hypothetical protein
LEAELSGHKLALTALQQQLDHVEKERKEIAENAATLEARSKQLQTAHADLEKQVTTLTDSLNAENERREEDQDARSPNMLEYQGELEAALQENQLIDRLLQREREASENATRRAQLETELAEKQTSSGEVAAGVGRRPKAIGCLISSTTRLAGIVPRGANAGIKVGARGNRSNRSSSSQVLWTRRNTAAKALNIGPPKFGPTTRRDGGPIGRSCGNCWRESQKQQQEQRESAREEKSKIEARRTRTPGRSGTGRKAGLNKLTTALDRRNQTARRDREARWQPHQRAKRVGRRTGAIENAIARCTERSGGAGKSVLVSNRRKIEARTRNCARPTRTSGSRFNA